MKKIFFLVHFLLFIISSLFAIDAKIISNPERQYPSCDFIYAVGSGRTEKKARTNAVSSIAMTFNVKVESVNKAVETLEQMSENDKTTYSKKQSISTEMKTQTAADLYCVKFSESYYDKKERNYYVIAYIDRKESSAFYRVQILKMMNQVDNLIKNAETEKEALYVIFNYQRAKVYCDIVSNYINTAIVINPNDINVYQKNLETLKLVDGYFTSHKRRVTFSIKTAGRGADQFFTSIAEIMQNDGFICTASKAKYYIDASVTYEEIENDAGLFVLPSVNIMVSNPSGLPVESYSKVHSRYGGYDNYDKAYKLAYLRIQQDLEENFLINYRGW